MQYNLLIFLIKKRPTLAAAGLLGLGIGGGYILTVKHPAIAATGTLNGTEITLTENHRHGQIFRFVKKNLEKLRS